MTQLILEDIVKSFGKKEVLRGASFPFEKGKIYGLLGRNGAGKTTLFNCISGEIPADGGTIRLMEDGQDVYDPDKIGFSFAEPVLPEFLTGYEYLRFFTDIHRGQRADIGTPEEYFRLIRIAEEDQHRLIRNYSQGMKNKLQIVSLLIARPPVLLLDEPRTSFDVVVAHEMKEILVRMKQDHIILFSTHILQIAADICDEVVMLHGGKLTGLDSEQIRRPDFEEQVVRLLTEEET